MNSTSSLSLCFAVRLIFCTNLLPSSVGGGGAQVSFRMFYLRTMQHVHRRWGFIRFSGAFQIILVCLDLRHIIKKLIKCNGCMGYERCSYQYYPGFVQWLSFFTSFLVSIVIISIQQQGIQAQDVPGFLTLWRWCHFLLRQRAGEVWRSLWISVLLMEKAPISKYLSEST